MSIATIIKHVALLVALMLVNVSANYADRQEKRFMKRTGIKHTSVQRGKKVWVFLQGGGRFLAKFKETTSKFIFFYDRKRIPIYNVRCITLARGNHSAKLYEEKKGN